MMSLRQAQQSGQLRTQHVCWRITIWPKLLSRSQLGLLIAPKLLPLPLPELVLLSFRSHMAKAISGEKSNYTDPQQGKDTKNRLTERAYSKVIHLYATPSGVALFHTQNGDPLSIRTYPHRAGIFPKNQKQAGQKSLPMP